MSDFKKKLLIGFTAPTELPKNETEKKEWQKANYSWWESHPMRYDWNEKIQVQEFSKEFYKEIDSRFFSNSREYMSWQKTPFDKLIDFESLKNKDVLEIGVGNGSHAQLLAEHSKTFNGIDITDYAVKSANKRFEVFGLSGEIRKMDAEQLDFPDNSFDFVWSWGVIHHSSNTAQILKEIHRVLRPNGVAIIMVYYRGWWNYYVSGLVRGLLTGNIFKTKSLHKIVQMYTDGAIARYYSFSDWHKLTYEFISRKTSVMGPKSDLILLPGGQIKSLAYKVLLNVFCKFLTSRLRMGSFLVSQINKTG